MTGRVAVLIPCFNDGRLLEEAVGSIDEPEPVEIIVIDDASTEEETLAALERVAEHAGVRLLRHDRNRGLQEARMTGIEATEAPYVFPLDADDLAIPGVFSRMADLLDDDPGAALCVGDYEEFGDHESVVAVPDRLDPFRLAYTQEYGPSLLRRRAVLEVGGWRQPSDPRAPYEDWHLFMSLAERGHRAVRLPVGELVFRRRLHGQRMLTDARRTHRRLYRNLRQAHPELFARVREHRRASELSRLRKLLYPFVYGARPRFAWERRFRFWLDRHGIWTLRRRGGIPSSQGLTGRSDT